MRRFLLLFICLIGVTATFGQYTSRGGRFKVDQVKGCAPFTITITDTNVVTSGECTGSKPCLMDFEGKGATSTNSFSFTYTTPGTYKLSVQYQSIGADDITVTVVDNKDPTFEVYTCTGNKVDIKVTDKSYDTYLIDFNTDNTIDTTIPSGNNATAQFNYPAAGNYNITVRGKNVNAADNCKNLSQSYQTLATMPTPSLNTMTAVDANNLKLDMTTTAHINYKMEIAVNNAGPFQVYEDLYQVSTVNIPNLLVDANYYCFRLSAFDPCAATNTYSNLMCSQDLDVAFDNGVNNVTWKTSASGVNTTSIVRNGTAVSSNAPGSYSNGVIYQYPDKDYDCNQQYCYQIVQDYGSGKKSTSLQKCGTGILQITYPAIENVTSVVRVGAELSYKIDPLIKNPTFDILKSFNGSSLSGYATTSDLLYIDTNYDYNGGQCYQVNYHDKCGNKSAPGIIACPMALHGVVNEDNNIVTLDWNAYKGYNLGVESYQVNKYDQKNGLIGVYPTNDSSFVDNDPGDEQVVIYSITALAKEAGVQKSFSNNVIITKPVKLILPTAFTPNGDPLNNAFTVSGKYVSRMSLKIFDRWGVMVFSSDKNEPWNGTKDGKPMPESSYVWKAEVTDTTGKVINAQGTVLLLRPGR